MTKGGNSPRSPAGNEVSRPARVSEATDKGYVTDRRHAASHAPSANRAGG